MSVLRATLALALAALAASAAAAVPAGAAPSDCSAFQVIDAGTALFPDRRYIVTLPCPRAVLDTAQVKVTENGAPVKNLSVLSASAEGIGTVLLIDASNSMKNSIGAAMNAARAFAARNPGQPLSVLYFSAKPTVGLRLTTDRAAVRKALAKPPKLAEGTHLYDALAAAVAQVRGSALGAARIVLLSDGDDVGSTTSLSSALAQLEAQRIRVFTVGIASEDFSPADLEQIAKVTGGTYGAATSPAALTKIYNDLGFRLGNEYLLSYRSTAAPDSKIDVDVVVKGAEPVAFSYTSPSTGTAAPYEPALRDRLLQSWGLLLVLVGLMLALATFAARSLWSLRSNRALVARLGEFVTLPAEEQAAARRKEVDILLAAVGPQKQERRGWRWLEGFGEDADVAQINHDPSKMVWAAALIGLFVGLVASVLITPFSFLLGVIPPVALNIWVRGKAQRVRNEFAEQLPENLDVLASALRAGHSLAGAMGVVADEAPEPSKREFARVVTDEQLGIPLDEALEVAAKRMQSGDMDQVAVLALVQREAGGNTAEVLDQVTKNIRARMDIRRLVRVLTTQGKFSSWVVAGVPLGVVAFLMMFSPQFLKPLATELLGQIFAVGAAVMMLVGFWIIRQIVKIEL